jgi:hypothetical protein
MRICILLAFFALTGCLMDSRNQDRPSPPGAVASPGSFRLSKMQGLEKRTAGQAGDSGIVFDLDTLSSSGSQYFILQNGGDSPIRDIRLSTDKYNFSFKPSEISTLDPAGDVAMMQVLKLAIKHGVKLDGIGYDSLLQKGEQVSNGLIEGVTKDSTKDVKVSHAFKMKVYAKVTDIRVFSAEGEIDLAKPNGTSMSGLTLGSFPYFRVYARTIKIINSGNVDLVINEMGNSPGQILTNHAVPVGDSILVPLSVILEINGGGVITDRLRLPLASNGKCYLNFEGSVPVPDPGPGKDSL